MNKCEQVYPHWVEIFKDNDRYLVNAQISDLAGFFVSSPWFEIIGVNDSEVSLGESIFRGLDYIQSSERFDGYKYAKENGPYAHWFLEGKYDNWNSFYRSCVNAHVWLRKDGTYKVFSVEKNFANSGCPATIKEISLEPDSGPGQIGTAIDDVCEAAEYHEKNKKLEKRYRHYRKQEEKLICGRKIEYYPPKDKHFEELGGGENFALYQRYDYYSESTSEDVISVFGIDNAEELDNDLSKENILAAWTKQFGEPETFSVKEAKHGIFTLRAEMFNKKYHRLAYIVKVGEDELLTAVMLTASPYRRKKKDLKLTELFDEFSGNIRFSE